MNHSWDAGPSGPVRAHWRHAPARALACALAVAALCLAAGAQAPPAARQASATLPLRIIVTSSHAEAVAAARRVGAGEPFDIVAREVSVDPSAAAGGSLGHVTVADLRSELQAALRALPPGALSSIVAVPTGFVVLRIDPEDGAGGTDTSDVGAAGSAVNAGLSVRGNVRYVLEMSGFPEARTALETYRKAPDWNHDPQVICDTRRASLAAMLESLEQHLGSLGDAPAPSADLMQVHGGMGMLHAYDGRMVEAIRHLHEAQRVAIAIGSEVALALDEALGVAYLHKAAADDGVPGAPGVRSLITARPHQGFGNAADIEQAIAHFLKYLSSRPDDIEVKWLLNLACRAAGRYPAGVPPEHLVPPAAFTSAEDPGSFRDVAAELGLVSIAMAGGVIVDDFDGDGGFEVVTSSMGSCAPMRFFRRNADGLFADEADTAGLAGQLGGLNLLQADYDNDGCLDILLLRGGWDVPQRKSLLRNDCKGGFTDVTVQSGLAVPVTATQTAAWLDFDGDGHLDLFVGNENAPAQLFMNLGDGTFVDVAGPAGVQLPGFIKGVAAGDYDNDGWTDLYVSNVSGPNVLFRNSGGGTFTDVTEAAGVVGPERGFATWFFDYDNDGWLDLFATSYFLSVEESARTYLGLPHHAPTLKLYRNRGDGTFADVTAETGLDKVFMPMGANFGDIDNDGWLDIYLGTGSPSYAALVPSVLLRNREGRAFVDVTASSGTGELGKGHGVAFADLDGDGDDEIVFEVGGATPGDAHALRVFDNPGHGHSWIDVSLVGVTSNRAAVGARIAVTARASDGTRRTVHRTVGSGGSFGASPLRQHIGLGTATSIDTIDVWWPTSGARQRFTGVAVNQWIQATENDDTFARRQRYARRPSGTAP